MRTLFCLLFIGVLAGQSPAFATSYPEGSIAEKIAEADVVIVGKGKSSRKIPPFVDGEGYLHSPWETVYQITEVLKDEKNSLKRRKQITCNSLRSAEDGETELLLGRQGDKLNWNTPILLTPKSLAYIKALPKKGTQKSQRLEFFLKNLENSDPFVAEDAHTEISRVPFAELRRKTEKLPRENLRKWIASKDTEKTRLRLYGRMLGACGNQDDASFLEKIIKQPAKDFRWEIYGVMEGYLIITGESGLKLLEDTKLKRGVKTPFSETYAAVLAVEFYWEHGDNIPKDRLKQSMRLLLDRPELADLALRDLIRWKDWECQEKVMSLYDQKAYDLPSVKRAIARYLLASQNDSTDDDNGNPTEEHAKDAAEHLRHLRNTDPRTVEQAERYFYVN